MWVPRLHFMPCSLIRAVARELTLNLMDSSSRSKKPDPWVSDPLCRSNGRLTLFPQASTLPAFPKSPPWHVLLVNRKAEAGRRLLNEDALVRMIAEFDVPVTVAHFEDKGISHALRPQPATIPHTPPSPSTPLHRPPHLLSALHTPSSPSTTVCNGPQPSAARNSHPSPLPQSLTTLCSPLQPSSVERWSPPFCGIRTSVVCWLSNQSVGSPVPRQKKRCVCVCVEVEGEEQY